MPKRTLGVIVGSNRRESINRRLAKALTKLVEDRFDWRWIRIDDLPMCNQDLEGARPDVVNRFTAEVAGVPALLFVTLSTTGRSRPVLKNAIDWGSKPTDKQVWRGHVAAITGTSFGVIGTGGGPAPAADPRHSRRDRDGRRGLHLVQARAGGQRRQLPRRRQAHVLPGLHEPVRRPGRSADWP